MSLLNFPHEVLLNICEQGQPSLKSIRLTCHKLGAIATTILFRYIRISPLRQDRSKFFNIAKTFPDLVRVVTWEELNEELDRFDPFHLLEDDDIPAPSSSGDIVSEVRALVWTEPDSAHSDFLNEFQNVIYKMSGLHTLASKPMDPQREVTLSTLDYTITIDMITRIIRNEDLTYLNSNGLINFIIPTLKALANPSSLSIPINGPPTITTVIYTDRDIMHSTALTRITQSDAMVSSTIRHLDLCIGGLRCVRADLEGFLTCLSNARNLTSFKLSQEACMSENDSDLYYMATPDPEATELLSLIPTMPGLTELHLVDPDLRAGCQQTSWLIKFIGHHSETLKRVYQKLKEGCQHS